jgi:hypothetical protein
MSIPPKRNLPYLDKKGVRYLDKLVEYPVSIGKLREYKNTFKDVTVELTRKGANYYLHFYDRFKGLVAIGRISKLDAASLLHSQLAKNEYTGSQIISPEDFVGAVKNIEIIFIDK